MNTYKTMTCTVEICPKGFKNGKKCPALKFLAKSYMKGTIGACPVRKDYPSAAAVPASKPIDRIEQTIATMKGVKEMCLF